MVLLVHVDCLGDSVIEDSLLFVKDLLRRSNLSLGALDRDVNHSLGGIASAGNVNLGTSLLAQLFESGATRSYQRWHLLLLNRDRRRIGVVL